MHEKINQAVFVLPYRKIHVRTILGIVVEWEYELFLLERDGIVTTAGGLRRENESAYDCARRELRDQLGMEATTMHASVAHIRGHFEHQLIGACFTTPQVKLVAEPTAGCKRIRMSLEDAVGMAWKGMDVDDAFTIQVLALYTGLLATRKIPPFELP